MPDKAYSFSIKIGKTLLDETAKRHLVRLSYEESLERTAMFEFAIRDSESFRLQSLPLCTETEKLGLPVEFKLGFVNELMMVFSGEITRIEPVFVGDGISYVNVVCHDCSYKLKRVPEPHEFSVPDYPNRYTVARKIIEKHGLTPVINPVKALKDLTLEDDESITQTDDTDWEILSDIASRANLNLFVKFDKLFLVDDAYLSGDKFAGYNAAGEKFIPLRFVYHPNPSDLDDSITAILQSFSPEVGSEDQRQYVEVISWDSINEKGERFGKASLSQTEHKGKAYSEITFKATRTETLRLYKVAQTPAKAKSYARAELDRRAARLVKGDGVLANGNPHLRMGQTHEIVLRDLEPIGKQFSGNYLITAVRHEIDEEGMCRTSFDVRKDGLAET